MVERSILSRERKARRKAYELGYKVKKGFKHWMYNGAVFRNMNGEALTGYMVEDLSTGYYVWDSYDNNLDHQWTLENVEDFLKDICEKNGLKY